MSRLPQFLFLLILSLAIASCNETITKIENQTPTINVTSANYSKVDSNFYYEIDLNYPVINGPISESVLNHINNTIAEKFYDFIPQKSFIESHQELPEHYSPSVDLLGILQNSYGISQCDSIVHIWFSIYQYHVGAAHGTTVYQTLHFNLNSGKSLYLNDFFKINPKTLPVFKTILNQNLPDSICWGFDTDTSITQNIKNFIILGDSISFKISDHQLCPYAMGLTEITIPKSSLNELLIHNQSNTCFKISPEYKTDEIATH